MQDKGEQGRYQGQDGQSWRQIATSRRLYHGDVCFGLVLLFEPVLLLSCSFPLLSHYGNFFLFIKCLFTMPWEERWSRTATHSQLSPCANRGNDDGRGDRSGKDFTRRKLAVENAHGLTVSTI